MERCPTGRWNSPLRPSTASGFRAPAASTNPARACLLRGPYYPIPRADNRALYERYRKLAVRETNVTFVGRLAEYRYYNMDQVVASALATFEALAAVAQVAS